MGGGSRSAQLDRQWRLEQRWTAKTCRRPPKHKIAKQLLACLGFSQTRARCRGMSPPKRDKLNFKHDRTIIKKSMIITIMDVIGAMSLKVVTLNSVHEEMRNPWLQLLPISIIPQLPMQPISKRTDVVHSLAEHRLIFVGRLGGGFSHERQTTELTSFQIFVMMKDRGTVII